MTYDPSALNFEGVTPKSAKRGFPSIFVKDANLQIHVPEAKDVVNMDGTHSFKNMLSRYVEDVNALQHDADAQVQRLVAGETENLHEVTLAMDEAKTAFDLMMQMRNQLVESYKEIARG
ncbi:Flagellar hook-basal body complex protein FliE [Chlamydiales bacterium SCGC AG-110-M15]|nr:Flagellar hook-basal body complex protein FliE [Chlamydiales bacterium SCGC AG-110-M15]